MATKTKDKPKTTPKKPPKGGKPKKAKASGDAPTNGEPIADGPLELMTVDELMNKSTDGEPIAPPKAKPSRRGKPSVSGKPGAVASNKVAIRRAAEMLKMVADPTRVSVLLTLLGGPQNVTELCHGFGQSQPAVSHHLALMRHGGLIAPERQGKNNYYNLTVKGEGLARMIDKIVGEMD